MSPIGPFFREERVESGTREFFTPENVTTRVDRLTPYLPFYVDTVDLHVKLRENHPPLAHLVNEGVDPVGEEPVRIRTLAVDRHFRRRVDRGNVGDQFEEAGRGGTKRLGQGLAARLDPRRRAARSIDPFCDLHGHIRIVDSLYMLIERNELQYDFGAARFEVRKDTDRHFLGWVFDQFLYGEVTGIQCGYWLYRAPTLAAASFLARQAAEELSHVKRIRMIQDLLGVQPAEAHPAVKFLSTGMMGGSWGEHVCLEMALGEGLVLTIFYALATTIDDEDIRKIVESACLDEERHVTFGESETRAWLARFPADRKVFLGQALLQWIAMRRLKDFSLKKLPPSHSVLEKFPAFYDHTLEKFDLRACRLGLSDRPLREIPWLARIGLIGLLPFRIFIMRRRRPKRLLTKTYLEDEWIRSPEKTQRR